MTTWNSNNYQNRWSELEDFYDYQFNKNNNMNDKFLFLTSSRFWALVIGALSIYLKMKGYIGEAEMQLIATITAGFTVIKTLDRNIGDAKVGTTTVSIPSGVSNVQASTDGVATGSNY